MLPRLVISCGLGIFIASGCRPATPGSTASTTNAALDTPVATDPAGMTEAALQALLADLTQTVRRYGVEQQQAPKSLDDLVVKGYLQAVPAAPPGKRFAISKTLQVYVTNP